MGKSTLSFQGEGARRGRLRGRMRSGVCDPREWRGGRDQSDKGEERLVDFAAARTRAPVEPKKGELVRGTRWWRDRAVRTTAVGIILKCARATCPHDNATCTAAVTQLCRRCGHLPPRFGAAFGGCWRNRIRLMTLGLKHLRETNMVWW